MEKNSVKSILSQVSPFGAPAGTAIHYAAKGPPESDGTCPSCGGTGWESIPSKGNAHVKRCRCFASNQVAILLAQARIPDRFVKCELSNYEIGGHRSQEKARFEAQEFIRNYPVERKGLLLIGSLGVGKTHLAIGIIKELIRQKGTHCLFVEYRDLLKQIQNSYNPSTQTTELGILQPIFETEVLVLDELGAQKPTEWVWDTANYVLNTRYNDNRTTIFTTNLQDEPALLASKRSDKDVMREDTLGDRIGERMRSRVHEMCRKVEITGKDRRSL